jgi:hypothetical protein
MDILIFVILHQGYKNGKNIEEFIKIRIQNINNNINNRPNILERSTNEIII